MSNKIIRRDKMGREIRPGDLLKVFHFIGARNKKHYMYKIAHSINIYLYAAHAHQTYKKGLSLKNSYYLPKKEFLNDYEIIDGYDGGNFQERKKKC